MYQVSTRDEWTLKTKSMMGVVPEKSADSRGHGAQGQKVEDRCASHIWGVISGFPINNQQLIVLEFKIWDSREKRKKRHNPRQQLKRSLFFLLAPVPPPPKVNGIKL